MNNIKELISFYLQSKQDAWSHSTLESERYRLNSVKEVITGDAQTLWDGIRDRAPYTRVTIWVRVTDFYQWCIDNGHVTGGNIYRKWRSEHAKQFKNAYVRDLPQMSYDEAIARIEQITDPAIRRRALEMLGAGTRWCESSQLDSDTVTGKGGKRRRIYRPDVSGPDFTRTYRTFLRALESVGLKPHMLRKLCATRLAHNGAHESDLCKIMGWESFSTARNYIAPVEEKRLEALMTKVQGGTNDRNEPAKE